MTRLWIHAANVHQGGGAVLLSALLGAIPNDVRAIAVLDARFPLPEEVGERMRVVRVEPTLVGRFRAECLVSREARNADCVLRFGNLPPIFRTSGDVSVFLQNRYLVDPDPPLHALPVRLRLRLVLERFWLRSFCSRASRYIVQTPSMSRLASEVLKSPVVCAPFVPDSLPEFSPPVRHDLPPRFDFIYVASGEAHKNHRVLVRAWHLLADEGLFPSLCLTLSPELAPELVAHVDAECAGRGLRIQNLGALTHDKLLATYRDCGALIYPSAFESFGLPLVEARRVGLAILAPELDYVRDVICPDETFDPHSAVSIARAIKRYMYGSGAPAVAPLDPKSFMEHLLRKMAA